MRLVLLALGVGVAQLAWMYLTKDMLVYLSGISAPFCLLCAGVIWGIRDKSDEALSGDDLESAAFEKIRRTAASVRRKATRRAAWVALAALAAISPATSVQLTKEVWHWMVLLAGAGVAEAAYGYLIAEFWDVDLRAYRDQERKRFKVLQERAALFERIEASRQAGIPTTGEWRSTDPSLRLAKPVH